MESANSEEWTFQKGKLVQKKCLYIQNRSDILHCIDNAADIINICLCSGYHKEDKQTPVAKIMQKINSNKFSQIKIWQVFFHDTYSSDATGNDIIAWAQIIHFNCYLR